MFDIFNKKYHKKNFFKVISDNANWSFYEDSIFLNDIFKILIKDNRNLL